MKDRIRLKKNPPNVSTPAGSVDLYFDSSGNLVKEMPGGAKEPVGSGSVTSASVVAAIAGDPAATRTAAGLGNVDNTADADKPTSTATQTTLDLKVDKGAVIYAADYGVTADGTTDDTDALQDAINAAVDLGVPTKIVLPAGIIRLNRTSESGVGNVGDSDKHSILLYSNLTLQGQGMGVTTLKPLDSCVSNTPIILAHNSDTTGTNARSQYPNGAENITIRDLSIDGNEVARSLPNDGAEDEGINIKSGVDCLIQNVEVFSTGQDGIDLDAGSNIRILDCYIHETQGNGIHNAGTGPQRTLVSRCRFEDCGHERAASDSTTGAAIDCTGSQDALRVESCNFVNNARALLPKGGTVLFINNLVSHGTTGFPAVEMLDPAATSYFLADGNRFSWSTTDKCIDIKDSWDRVWIINNWFGHTTSSQPAITATSAGRVVVRGNYFNAVNYAFHLVSAGSGCDFSDNIIAVSSSALRVEGAVNGFARRNQFLSNAGGHVQWRSGSSGWTVEENYFAGSGIAALQNVSGGGANTIYRNNKGAAYYIISVSGCLLEGNEIGTFTVSTAAATGNRFVRNNITGTVTHTTATYDSNDWFDNYGSSMSGVFSGSATLVSGTATVNTPAAYSGKRIRLSRHGVNSSIAIGSLALGTVTAGTSFVINSLAAGAMVEIGDLSTVKWEIEE